MFSGKSSPHHPTVYFRDRGCLAWLLRPCKWRTCCSSCTIGIHRRGYRRMFGRTCQQLDMATEQERHVTHKCLSHMTENGQRLLCIHTHLYRVLCTTLRRSAKEETFVLSPKFLSRNLFEFVLYELGSFELAKLSRNCYCRCNSGEMLLPDIVSCLTVITKCLSVKEAQCALE